MSRIGKQPISVPAGVKVDLKGDQVTVTGSKGTLKRDIIPDVEVVLEDNVIRVNNRVETKKANAFRGLTRSLINNMVIGVTDGFEKKLEVNGVGYRVALSGKKLVLNVGYSHPVDFELPEGISAQVEGNVITISGIDKQLVGEVSAKIRKVRKPEPYKGKGIKYMDEIIRRKEGKTAGKGE